MRDVLLQVSSGHFGFDADVVLAQFQFKNVLGDVPGVVEFKTVLLCTFGIAAKGLDRSYDVLLNSIT